MPPSSDLKELQKSFLPPLSAGSSSETCATSALISQSVRRHDTADLDLQHHVITSRIILCFGAQNTRLKLCRVFQKPHIYIYIFIYLYIHTHTYTHIHLCVCVCEYVCECTYAAGPLPARWRRSNTAVLQRRGALGWKPVRTSNACFAMDFRIEH